jgi:arabinogalactan oligomer/maltooligosaccharide transport system permease protein
MAVAEMTARAPGRPLGRWGNFKRRVKESRTPWLYILPSGLIMLVITFLPQIYQVWMGFTDFRIANLRYVMWKPSTWAQFAPTFVGLQNYVKILTSQLAIENYSFVRLLSFNIIWTVTNVVVHVLIGVACALALNAKKLIGRRVYRVLFVLPWAIPGYIAALTWANMYDPRFGAFNQLLGIINRWLGTSLPTNTQWLTMASAGGFFAFLPVAFFCVLVANIWLGWPFMMVIATGALQSIPNELYEAASIDGANGWQNLWRITVPLIRPAMVPAIMLGTIWTFNQFNVIYFISQGGPAGRTEILITQAFKLVYSSRLYGVAAAFSIVVFFILLIITLLQNRVTRATEAYYA